MSSKARDWQDDYYDGVDMAEPEVIYLDEDAFTELLEWLEAPPQVSPKLAALFERTPPWAAEEEEDNE